MPVDVVVIGLGHTGLPVVRAAVRAGMAVAGLDLDQRVIERINNGISPVDNVSDAALGDLLEHGFTCSTDPQILVAASNIIVAVGTPAIEGEPDLQQLLAAVDAVADYLTPGQLVVIESAVLPGTSDAVLLPMLEANGLVAGRDFNFAVAPTRVDPTELDEDVAMAPRPVAGHTHACFERASGLYKRITHTVVPLASLREAEFTQFAAQAFKQVNQALANELTQLAREFDVDSARALDAAWIWRGSAGPAGPQANSDLAAAAGSQVPLRLLATAYAINRAMPAYVVRRVQQILNRHRKPLHGSTVLLVGITYAPDIGESRYTPAKTVAQLLSAEGATVRFHDPRVAEWRAGADGQTLSCEADVYAAAANADLLVLLQNHTGYDLPRLLAAAPAVLDVTGDSDFEHL